MVQAPSRWRSRLVVGLLVFVIGAIVALNVIKLDYFAESPGAAVPLEDRIEVVGAPQFDSDGEVHFTTVRITRRDVTLFEYLRARLDPATDLIPKEALLQGRTVEENRAFNQELMTNSQELAKRVALEQLGVDAIVENGVLIRQVGSDLPADGLLEPGDVLVGVNGTDVVDNQSLLAVMADTRPGDVVAFDVRRLRSGEIETVEIELAAADDGRAIIGVVIETSFDLTDLPFDIEIDTDRVGGPSAGLALTLSIIDVLTEGDLTGGQQIATTGEIFPNGAIGNVGGIRQKTYAVRRAGMDAFLVPADLAPEALEVAGDDLVIVPVATLDDALAAIADLGGNTDDLALPDEALVTS